MIGPIPNLFKIVNPFDSRKFDKDFTVNHLK